MIVEIWILRLLCVVLGVIGGIGWWLLSQEIYPEKLSNFVCFLITASYHYWLKNENNETNPARNPQKNTNRVCNKSQPSELPPSTVVIAPNNCGCRRTTNQQYDANNPISVPFKPTKECVHSPDSTTQETQLTNDSHKVNK